MASEQRVEAKRTPLEYGVKQVADQLNERLRQYLEGQYHIRDTGAIEERRRLLLDRGAIGQIPYLETTPTYETVDGYLSLGLPEQLAELLDRMSKWSPDVGIFPRPYRHQSEALTGFFALRKDLLVATGTGSGKTETFLLPILGNLFLEAQRSRASFAHRGVRAILLYPMNSLVSDQVNRLRRMFGDDRLAKLFVGAAGRPVQFGMYTSRTPYPGPRISTRDQHRVGPLLRYYRDLAHAADGGDPEASALFSELKAKGRWPAKDLDAFYGADHQRWEARLVTHPDDRELITRHEMQAQPPDILVTNYSMLEYMLMRPVERNMFAATREWLHDFPDNEIILVLDEAHLYRGVGGAEVAFLVRRLQARLGIPRDRMRCILTSASLGTTPAAVNAGKVFGVALTGNPNRGPDPFKFVSGSLEQHPGVSPADRKFGTVFAEFDLAAFFARAEDYQGAVSAIRDLAMGLGWPPPPESTFDQGYTSAVDPLRQYLYQQLSGIGVTQQLIELTVKRATAFDELAGALFPENASDEAERAAMALLALGSYARNEMRALLPTRLHLMFRGLPALYACINPLCEARRYKPGEHLLLGRLYTEPNTNCSCKIRARIYELYTHRDCGAAFLRVFGRGAKSDFYWHESGGEASQGQPLEETWLLLETPHPKMMERVQPIWLDLATGRASVAQPSDTSGYRLVYRPVESPASDGRRKQPAKETPSPFKSCPACTRPTGRKIMDLATKGEQPFANLVRSQFALQPATKTPDARFPNAGRKVLLFSDGRQKAARLARDLPREVEFDTFREAIVLAAQRLSDLGKEAVLNERLYLAFLDVVGQYHLYFFDRERNSQQQLLNDVEQYAKVYDRQLADALDDDWRPRPPTQYQQALLRQLCDPFYSLHAACAAVVLPTKTALRRLQATLREIADIAPNELAGIAAAWIQELLEETAFDPTLSAEMRRLVDAYHRPLAQKAPISSVMRLLLDGGGLAKETAQAINDALYAVFTQPHHDEGSPYLDPSSLRLSLAINDPWQYCTSCGLTNVQAVFGRCPSCQATSLEQRESDHPYMTSRKGYFLEPLRAVLAGATPIHLSAEEHTAQLSHRDYDVVYATTEKYELAFQDVVLGKEDLPVDVLSCTTTMEVGVDIGSLTAVGLRNVPPQRENYQQRSGRSGRRGAAVSTVVTYAQGGPHDNYYYSHPVEVIAGEPREPRIKVDNVRLASRHINSHLVQTFFHHQLDTLSATQLAETLQKNPGVFSSLGTAHEFFTAAGLFNFNAFASWINVDVIGNTANLDALSDWLPDELCHEATTAEARRLRKRDLTKTAALSLLATLKQLGTDLKLKSPADGVGAHGDGATADDDDLETTWLLDLLFDSGLLPSYAFPTNLCTFYVFEQESPFKVRIREKASQGKEQALSEYAPGRLLVINKETYRVGGIYEEGTGSARPAVRWFANPLDRYTSCPVCTYVRTGSRQSESEQCPVCHETLVESEILDPPGFSPERGRPLRERDRDQDLSYATSAQFPVPLAADDLSWNQGAYRRLQYAYGENRRLLVVNKGPSQRGFVVCEDCGAAWPSQEAAGSEEHVRPFLVSQKVLTKDKVTNRCHGPLHAEAIHLGATFLTDLFIARIEVGRPLVYDPRHPWLHDALRSASEAIAQAASLVLDIDPGELSAGYRLMPGSVTSEGTAACDVYLFDTASGGAGYAAAAGAQIAKVLEKAAELATSCPAQCDRSCTKCLRHYGNRYWHERLDRHLAVQLIRYAQNATAPSVASVEEQANQLTGLSRYLQLEGWSTQIMETIGDVVVPLLVKKPQASILTAIGTVPALVDLEDPDFRHPLHELDAVSGVRTAFVNDYVLARDLPAAYDSVRSRLTSSS